MTLKALNEACVETGVCEREPSDHELLLHFGETELCSPGIVVNVERARTSPCSCFTYKGKDICHVRGVIGTLNQDQQAMLCVAGKVYKEQPKLVERYQKFAEAAEIAHQQVATIPKGERMGTWLSAMATELSKRGIEV
jgi:hypothetical protein